MTPGWPETGSSSPGEPGQAGAVGGRYHGTDVAEGRREKTWIVF